jgi:L-threonylcarbamoyladenylate synthase
MAVTGKDILEAKKILEHNDLVAIPTETVYGLAGNALSEEAVLKIFMVKNRPVFDPLIVHTYDFSKISEYVADIPEKALVLAEKFMPGALTLLLPKKAIIPDLVTSGLDNVAIRIPNHPLTLELLQNLDFPLAAPSANPFGYISPTTALHVENQLGSKISYILDGGEATVGIESTIVGFEEGEAIVYRLGGISIEAIEGLIGRVKMMAYSSSDPKAPGMLKSHYAPRKKVFLSQKPATQTKEPKSSDIILKDITDTYGTKQVGILNFCQIYLQLQESSQLVLSENSSLEEAARNLFAMLRKLDSMPIEVIFAELLPETGIGRAINDRLRRAAAE